MPHSSRSSHLGIFLVGIEERVVSVDSTVVLPGRLVDRGDKGRLGIEEISEDTVAAK